MARTRNLKPGFFTNEHLAALPPLARLLYAGLWCWADRNGVLEDRHARIKAEVLPYDSCDADLLLEALHASGMIVRYQKDGQHLIHIPTFLRHQTPHKNELGRLPLPDEGSVESGKSPNGSAPSSYVPSSFHLGSFEPQNGSKPTTAAIGAARELTTDPVVLTFPVVGDPQNPEWPLTASKVAELREAFPGLDVGAESRKSLAWLNANPLKRKTARGMSAFLFRWMERAQNSRGGPSVRPDPGASVADARRREREENMRRLAEHRAEEALSGEEVRKRLAQSRGGSP